MRLVVTVVVVVLVFLLLGPDEGRGKRNNSRVQAFGKGEAAGERFDGEEKKNQTLKRKIIRNKPWHARE